MTSKHEILQGENITKTGISTLCVDLNRTTILKIQVTAVNCWKACQTSPSVNPLIRKNERQEITKLMPMDQVRSRELETAGLERWDL